MNTVTCCLRSLILILAMLAPVNVSRASNALTTAPAVDPVSNQSFTSLLTGIWKFSWPDPSEPQTRIELLADGNYEWWAPHLESELAARTMLQSGKWSVNERRLSLRIEKVFLGHVPPGTTFTYNILSISLAKAVLNSAENREVTLTRLSKQDIPFWMGALSYKPPFKMSSYMHPTNASARVPDWELNSGLEAGTNAHAQVVFHIETLAEFISDNRPAKPLESIDDVKGFIDSTLEADLGGRHVTSMINIDGRKALMFMGLPKQGSKTATELECGVCFFWRTDPIWTNSTLCSITMTAETAGTLSLLTNSLRTMKVHSQK